MQNYIQVEKLLIIYAEWLSIVTTEKTIEKFPWQLPKNFLKNRKLLRKARITTFKNNPNGKSVNSNHLHKNVQYGSNKCNKKFVRILASTIRSLMNQWIILHCESFIKIQNRNNSFTKIYNAPLFFLTFNISSILLVIFQKEFMLELTTLTLFSRFQSVVPILN